MGVADSMIDLERVRPATMSSIRKHPIFDGVTDEEIKRVLPFFKYATLNANEPLLQEGQLVSLDLYLILTGKLSVIRRSEKNPADPFPWFFEKDFSIATLGEGDSVGELSFVRGGNRSASIQCEINAEFLVLSPDKFEEMEDSFPHLASRIMRNQVGITARLLKETTDNKVAVLKIELQNSMVRSKANLFFSYVIGLMCVYNLGIQQIINLAANSNQTSTLSAIIILVFCAVLVLMIRQSGLPMFFFGLTFRNWMPAMKESILWSALIVAALFAAKWALVTYVPRYHHLPVISFDPSHTRYLVFNFALYGLHSPVQEFIVRGVLQSSLQNFFKGRNVTSRAILISNGIFSATHVHLLGGLLGAIVFVPGLFWGWMYARQKNLIGVSISHILVGWTALFFLDIGSLF